MDEVSVLTLQKEITELEQLLTTKKNQLEEAQTLISKQSVNSAQRIVPNVRLNR